ncbi:MAG TPA: J domain-containing protein [Telmatospirillum sp.]|nr:J domain-containing protein [Telmatospirillum sp.]
MNGQSRKFWPLPNKPETDDHRRSCDHPGCLEGGEFRAPKSRHSLHDYFWFCLNHVRAYNAKWDYYAGMRPEEIERMVRSDTTWQRPTWPLGRMVGGRHRFDAGRVKDPFQMFDDDFWQRPTEKDAASSAELSAMRVMDLSGPLTLEVLKARYKELCKRHHPDANGGDKDAEERFKRIGQAYKTLLESLNLS